MFDHLGFGVSGLPAGRNFFVAALAPLGTGVVIKGEFGVGLGKSERPALWLAPVEAKPGSDAAFVTGPDGHNVEAVCLAAVA